MNNHLSTKTKSVTIIIVTWNSKFFLSDLFQSIKFQNNQDFELIIIDNGSSDNSCEYIQKNYPEAKIVRNEKNVGFAQANNQGIKLAKTPYILICNPDIIMEMNFLSLLLNTIKSDNQIGACGGKLFKFNQSLKPLIIDSAGIAIFKSRRMIERGESEEDKGQFDQQQEVFGITGALVLYRKAALERVALNDEYFDEDFFAYKEDVDLAWRLRSAGYKSIYVPSARAYHKRGVARLTDLSDQGTIKNRQTKSKMANFLSYRNHLFLLIKNENFKNIFFNPYLLWYELKKFVFLFFQETITLTAWIDFFKKWTLMVKKRKMIKEKQNITAKELNKWFI